MTGYEFTKFNPAYACKCKAKEYDLNVLVRKIEEQGDCRTNADYEDCQNIYYELTQSCDLEECRSWMRFWMNNAIAYGIQTKNSDWRYKFLAAYDIWNGLQGGTIE